MTVAEATVWLAFASVWLAFEILCCHSRRKRDMLVLTRRKDEKITIGDGIEITIVAIRGDQVRIGITAPAETKVLRNELLTKPPKPHGKWRTTDE